MCVWFVFAGLWDTELVFDVNRKGVMCFCVDEVGRLLYLNQRNRVHSKLCSCFDVSFTENGMLLRRNTAEIFARAW